MNKRTLFISLIAILSITSCEKRTNTNPLDESEIEFSLSTEKTDLKTKAEVPTLDVSTFKVELINSKNVIFKRWNNYSEISGKKVAMNAGEYSIRATYGDSTKAGFSSFFFKGEKKFTVDPQTTKEVSVVCKQGNAKVAISYGANIKSDYTDYWVSVKNKSYSDSLKFLSNTTESGYVQKGDVVVVVYAKSKLDNKEHLFTSAPIAVDAADFMTFNVDTKEAPTVTVTLTITINTSTDDKNVTIDLPSYMLPKDPPSFVLQGFDQTTGILTEVEGVDPSSASLSIASPAGIKGCIMKVTSPYLTDQGWAAEYDLLNVSSADASLLTNSGFAWTQELKNAKMASLNFKNIIKNFKYTTPEKASNTFEIIVTDIYDQVKKDTVYINVEKGQIAISDVVSSSVWAKSADVTLSVVKGNPSLLKPEVSVDGLSWSVPQYTSSVSGKNALFNITGLSSNTTYYVRGTYNYGISSNMQFKTENQMQVGNGGFEDWTSGTRTAKGGLSKYNQPFYQPWTADQWWDSNNIATMPTSITVAYPNYKCFPTTSYTSSSRSGSKAAQVMSIAVNNANSEIVGSGSTVGKLFIGTTADDGSVSGTGHSFTSRPTKMEFYYKYAPNEGESFSATVKVLNGSTVIATGSLTNGATVSSYTKGEVNLTYSNTSLTATSIQIEFLSCSGSPKCSKKTVTIPAGDYKVYAGSILTIDDITMLYEK